MNIMPKHEGHATVASFDSQYWHCGESEEIAAPQFGQLRVSTVIRLTARVLACGWWAFCPPNSLALRVSPHYKNFRLLIYCEVVSILIFQPSGSLHAGLRKPSCAILSFSKIAQPRIQGRKP
jgi:hypothetical protein